MSVLYNDVQMDQNDQYDGYESFEIHAVTIKKSMTECHYINSDAGLPFILTQQSTCIWREMSMVHVNLVTCLFSLFWSI